MLDNSYAGADLGGSYDFGGFDDAGSSGFGAGSAAPAADSFGTSGSSAFAAPLDEPSSGPFNEPDRGMLAPTELELLAKLLFVDALRRERGRHPTFESLFNGLQPGAAGFDAFFTLERTPLDMSVEDALADALDEGTAETLANEHPRLAEYIRLARERSAQRARSG